MYYYGARYYDPRLSIFISVDPLAEQFVGWTPYHYVHQNPINLIDPTGMSADGWIEQNEDGKTTVTFDPKVNTTEEAVAAGYKNVLQVLPSGSLLGQYNLNSDGSVCGEDVDWRRSQSYSGMSYFWVDENTEVRTYNSDAWNSESAQSAAWQRRSSGAITPIGGPFDVTGAGEVFGGFLAEYFSNPLAAFSANMMFNKGRATISTAINSGGKNFKKITDKLLKNEGIDAHQLKREFLGEKAPISKYDLYKDASGEILILQKGGIGTPIRTGEFLK